MSCPECTAHRWQDSGAVSPPNASEWSRVSPPGWGCGETKGWPEMVQSLPQSEMGLSFRAPEVELAAGKGANEGDFWNECKMEVQFVL